MTNEKTVKKSSASGAGGSEALLRKQLETVVKIIRASDRSTDLSDGEWRVSEMIEAVLRGDFNPPQGGEKR